MPDERGYSIDEFASLIGVSRITVDRLIEDGLVAAEKHEMRTYPYFERRITEEEVRRYRSATTGYAPHRHSWEGAAYHRLPPKR